MYRASSLIAIELVVFCLQLWFEYEIHPTFKPIAAVDPTNFIISFSMIYVCFAIKLVYNLLVNKYMFDLALLKNIQRQTQITLA